MRRQAYAVAMVAAASCFLAGCSSADAKRTAAPSTAPKATPDALLRSAFVFADDWWQQQGSPPPCPAAAQITFTGTDGEHGGLAYYGSCNVEINHAWWTVASRVLEHGTLRGRRVMLQQLCVLAIHERGHNIGYRHTPTGVMRAAMDVTPGGCVLWAARMVPRR